MTTNQSHTPVHVEYRNGTYYGQLSTDYKRNGKGLLVLDTSTVLFAEWKDNQVEGLYVYLTDGIRAYGTMSNSKLDGYNIITTTTAYTTSTFQMTQYSSTNNQNTIRTFYGTFRNQKIYGRCVVIDNDSLMICQYSNNEMEEVNTRKSIRQRDVFQTLQEMFPNHLYTLDEYLTSFIKTFIAELAQYDEISRYEPCINLFSKQSDEKFFGFQQANKTNKKFGIVMRQNELISVGQHNNNLLQGIGRFYDKDHILDGAFRNGKVQGIGIDYNRINNKFILEIRDGTQDRIEKGFGFPLREILQYRKEFHLRSVFFYNDIAVLNLKQKYEGLITHIFVNPRRSTTSGRNQDGRYGGSNARSASKRIANSPLRDKLNKYQMQSDTIEDNSPLKNRPNQYRPIDKNSNYFKQENNYQPKSNNYIRENASYSRKNTQHDDLEEPVCQSRRFNQPPQQSNRSYEKNQRFSQDKSKNKLQERDYRQRQTYNEILKQNAPYLNQDPSQSRTSKTHSNYTQHDRSHPRDTSNTRNRKDTRDLVKELQNQEKERRLTLDEIYSKSNLYGRNKR